jgi:hypothetical protein
MGLTGQADPTSWGDLANWPDPADPRCWRAICLAIRERWQAAIESGLSFAHPAELKALLNSFPMRSDAPAYHELMTDISQALRELAPCFVDRAKILATNYLESGEYAPARFSVRSLITASDFDLLPPWKSNLRDPLVGQFMERVKAAIDLLRYTPISRGGCLKMAGFDNSSSPIRHATLTAQYHYPSVSQALSNNCGILDREDIGGSVVTPKYGGRLDMFGGGFFAIARKYRVLSESGQPVVVEYTGSVNNAALSYIRACDVRIFNTWNHNVAIYAACKCWQGGLAPSAITTYFDDFGSSFTLGENLISASVQPGDAVTTWPASGSSQPTVRAAPTPPNDPDDPDDDRHTETRCDCICLPYADHCIQGGFAFQPSSSSSSSSSQ